MPFDGPLMKTITFYSYKGGVGRTLALANMAKGFAELKLKVCILDFDLEAPGVHFKFPHSEVKINKGLVDYIYSFLQTGTRDKNLEEFVYKIPIQSIDKFSVDLFPAGNPDDPGYWGKLAKINWHELFYSENATGPLFFLELKERIKKELNPDVLLIDSRTGITEIAGITLSLLADEVVILSANNKESIDGSKRIIGSILSPKNAFRKSYPTLHFVLSRIPISNKNESVIKKRTRKIINDYLFGIQIPDSSEINEILIIHSDRGLEESEELKIQPELIDHEGKMVMFDGTISGDYQELFKKLSENFLSRSTHKIKLELSKARSKLRKSEEVRSTDPNQSIKLVHEVVELFPNFGDAVHKLGHLYIDRKDFKNAEKFFMKAIDIDEKNPLYHNSLGKLFLSQGMHKKAKSEFEIANKINPDDLNSILGLSDVYGQLNEPKKALSFLNKSIELSHIEVNHNYILLYKIGRLYRMLEKYREAEETIGKSLYVKKDFPYSYAILAEIKSENGEEDQFYENFEKALRYKLPALDVIEKDKLYEKYKGDKRFIELLEKYGFYLED